jgi:hypothetical protein
MIEHTLSQLRQLKLNGMASALQIQLEQPGAYEDLAFAERLQLLVDHEDQERNQRKQEHQSNRIRSTHHRTLTAIHQSDRQTGTLCDDGANWRKNPLLYVGGNKPLA